MLLILRPAQNMETPTAEPGSALVCAEICSHLPVPSTSKDDERGEKRQNNCLQLWCNVFTYTPEVSSKSWQVTEGKTDV